MTSTTGDRAEDAVRADALPALVGPGGKALSWGDLFDEYAPALNYYARSRGVREPEHLVQQVFVAAFRRLPRFIGDRPGLRSLIFTIAYRRTADRHRWSTRRLEGSTKPFASMADEKGVVDDTVDTLVDEAVQPMVDETVEPLVQDLTDPLEDLVPGLDGLLGDG